MSRVHWIQHNGKEILFSNYADLSPEDLMAEVLIADTELFPKIQHRPKESILSLADVANSVASKEAVNALKNSVKLWLPLYKKQAVIGLSSFHYIFLHAVNKFTGGNVIPFKTKEEALDWLTED
jgi:hypothetical protein